MNERRWFEDNDRRYITKDEDGNLHYWDRGPDGDRNDEVTLPGVPRVPTDDRAVDYMDGGYLGPNWYEDVGHQDFTKLEHGDEPHQDSHLDR